MHWKLSESCESEALGDLMSECGLTERWNNKHYGRRELRAVDCDPTLQVGTDLPSHLSALPWFHSSCSRVRKILRQQTAGMMDASYVTHLAEL